MNDMNDANVIITLESREWEWDHHNIRYYIWYMIISDMSLGRYIVVLEMSQQVCWMD